MRGPPQKAARAAFWGLRGVLRLRDDALACGWGVGVLALRWLGSERSCVGRPSSAAQAAIGGFRNVLRLRLPLRACGEWWDGARRKPAARAAFCGLRDVLRQEMTLSRVATAEPLAIESVSAPRLFVVGASDSSRAALFPPRRPPPPLPRRGEATENHSSPARSAPATLSNTQTPIAAARAATMGNPADSIP